MMMQLYWERLEGALGVFQTCGFFVCYVSKINWLCNVNAISETPPIALSLAMRNSKT